MANRRLGGADRRVALGGAGSSPADSINETRQGSLRRMLRKRDAVLSDFDDKHKRKYMSARLVMYFRKVDAERRAIREKMKSVHRMPSE